eukprot:751696-Hanusia_phi.AAC.5
MDCNLPVKCHDLYVAESRSRESAMSLRSNLFPEEDESQSGEVSESKLWEQSKKVTILDEVTELGANDSNSEISPTRDKLGISSPGSTNSDLDASEVAIAKIERRLKKNIPNDERKKLEAEKESLLTRKKQETAPGETPNMPARAGQIRRKVGSVAIPAEEVQEEKKSGRSKVAPAPPAHPKTMARMKDWKRELERRMLEQDQLDKPKSKEDPNWFESMDGPVAQVVDFFQEFVDGMKKAIGMSETQEEVPQSPPRALPEQTFSRRL